MSSLCNPEYSCKSSEGESAPAKDIWTVAATVIALDETLEESKLTHVDATGDTQPPAPSKKTKNLATKRNLVAGYFGTSDPYWWVLDLVATMKEEPRPPSAPC